MDIYNIKTKQCEPSQVMIALSLHSFLVPSCAEILLELTDNEMGSSRSKRHTTWIGSGIKIQEMQYDFWQLSC
jgi:hypothetical protein